MSPAANPREPRPLMTREPLSQTRERRPAAPFRKKRKLIPPSKPALSYDAKHRHVPCGLRDPPVSPSTPILSRPSSPEPFTGSHDEQQMDPYPDRDIPDPFHDGHDVPRQPGFFSGHTSTESPSTPHSNTPGTEVNDMSSAPEMYDSPASYTSSSSPASSDQSPAEFGPEYTRRVQPPLSMYSYDGPFVHQPAPVVHQHYIYPMDPTPDRHAQNFPLQHFDPPYSRAPPHGGPVYPENNGYHYTTHRY